jgi:uncharacterized membrane protein
MRMGAVLRHRRRLRIGLVQGVYILGALGLGLLIPHISIGATIESRRATEMLVAIGAGFVPFIGIVYSLLFLVVQFGTTTFTPRLNLFRDSPIVWHGFSFFTGVIVFAFTAALAIAKDPQTTLLVPIAAMLAILVAIAVFRQLQGSAFKSIQLASTLAAVARRGREVVDGMYPDPIGAGSASDRATTGPASGRDVLWPSHGATLQIIDVRRLVRAAERTGAVIEVCVSPGEVIPEHGRVAVVHGGDESTDREASGRCRLASSGRSTRTRAGPGSARTRRYRAAIALPGHQRPDDGGPGARPCRRSPARDDGQGARDRSGHRPGRAGARPAAAADLGGLRRRRARRDDRYQGLLLAGAPAC